MIKRKPWALLLAFALGVAYGAPYAQGLQPMLRPEPETPLTPFTNPVPQSALTPLTPFTSPSLSALITPTLVAMRPLLTSPSISLIAMAQPSYSTPQLVAMAPPVKPASQLVAMAPAGKTTGLPLLAMVSQRPSAQVALTSMATPADALPLALASASYAAKGVIGPVPSAQGLGGTGNGGTLVAEGPAQSVAGTLGRALALQRSANLPGTGSEVYLALLANTKLYSQEIIAYRATQAGEAWVPLKAISEALGLGLQIDPLSGKITGWVSDQTKSLSIDLASQTYTLNGQRQKMPSGAFSLQPDDIYVSSSFLASLMDAEVKLSFRELKLALTTRTPLPTEAARARNELYARLTATPKQDDLMAEAQQLDYGLFSVPDVTLNYGTRFMGGTPEGTRQSQALSLQAQGTLLYASANVGLGLERDVFGQTNITSANMRLSRHSPSNTLLAEWLGPLAANKLEAGDIYTSPLALAELAGGGRGVYISNAPVGLVEDPERFVLEGAAPVGWDVEIYQNNGLLAFQRIGAEGRYSFKALPLRNGLNEFRIVQYGPRGEQESTTARYMLGDSLLAKGQLTYDVALYEPGAKTLPITTNNADVNTQPTLTQRYAYGLTSDITAQVGAFVPLLGGSTTLNTASSGVSAGLRGSIFDTFWQADALTQNDGARRYGAALRRTLPGDIDTRLAYTRADNETLNTSINAQTYEAEIGKVLRLGRNAVNNTLIYRRLINQSEVTTEEVQYRTGLSRGRLNISNDLTRRWQQGGQGATMQGNASLSSNWTTASAQVGLNYDFNNPSSILQDANLNIRNQFTEKLSADATLRRSFTSDAQSLGSALRYEFDRFSLGVSGQLDNNGAFATGLNLATQLTPNSNGLTFNNPRQALGTGRVTILAFLDENTNGVQDAGEINLPDITLRNTNRDSLQITNAKGEALFSNITANMPIQIVVDEDALPDSYLSPLKKRVVVIGDAGTDGVALMPFTKLGEIAGIAYKAGRDGRRVPVAGLEVLFTDAKGQIATRTTTGPDGYYVAGPMRVGTYAAQITPKEMKRTGLSLPSTPRFSLTLKANVIETADLTLQSSP